MLRRLAFLTILSIIVPTSAALAAPGEGRNPLGEGKHTGYVLVPPQTAEHAGEISKIIFLNRCVGGCRISPGGSQSDARNDVSSIPDEVSMISAWEHGDATWNELVACVTEVYAPYDVTVVTTDPGAETFHHEAIVAGRGSEVGLAGDILGIAPMSFDCSPQNNVISFSFANMYPASQMLELCATVAQESAHAFGMDHAFDCTDPMTYLGGCGQKFFRNKMMKCGEFAERPCQCTGSVMNSHVKLRSVFGDGTLPPPPTVSISLPKQNDAVSTGFTVYAGATDKRGVYEIDFYLNGWKWGTVEGHSYQNRNQPYQFTTPGELPDGYVDVEVRARNDLGSEALASITVIKGAPCTSEATCLGGQFCEEGRCKWPAPTGELGDACEIDQDCVSDVCASVGDTRQCSELCFPGVNDICPMGYECLAGGQSGACWPESGEGGGCCSVGNTTGLSLSQLALFGLVGLFLFGRRRRA